MKKSFLADLKDVIKVLSKKEGDLYYKKFQSSGLKKKELDSINEEQFAKIPVTTIKELALTPYGNRLTEEGPGFNKLILSEEAKRYYLVHRTVEEIRNQQLSVTGSRPMVLTEDVYEAIELCLYFYEMGKLPLIGEVLNPAIVYETAKQYQVDSLYMDQNSAGKFLNELLSLGLPVKSVTIIDSKKPVIDIHLEKNIAKKLVFSLPETGPILYDCPERSNEALIFHPTDDIYIEPGDKTVLTSNRLKSCPIIRVQMSFGISEVATRCSCKAQSFSFD